MKAISLWLALLLTPNLLFACVAEDSVGALMTSLPPSVALIAALLTWTRRPSACLALLAPFFGLLPLEWFYIIQYGRPSSPHVLAVLSESSVSEAVQYLGWLPLLALLAMGILLLTGTVAVARLAPAIAPHRTLRWMAWASLVPLLQYAWLEWDWTRKRQIFDPPAAVSSLLTNETATPTGAMLSDSWPLGVVFRVRDYLQERARLREAARLIDGFHYRPQRRPGTAAQEVYVLVLGESSHPAHWGLNGYSRPTTPELAALEGVTSFRNTVSPFPATRLAVPVILTGAQDPQSHRAPLGRASIVTLFKQAGFRTYWLSNQAPLGMHDSVIALHAYEADQVLYTNGGDHTQKGRLDDAMLPIFERFLSDPAPRKFFVVHLMGSHKAYAYRYPATFDRFRPSQQQHPGDEAPQTVVNTYDNTILFTDHVLAQLIQRLKRQATAQAALLYLSDHGQNLPSAACKETGHGRANEADHRVSAMLWLSDAYTAAFPDIADRARSRIDAPLYSPGAFHALADLAHINHSAHDARQSWLSDAFQPTRRWTIAAPDFDRAIKEPPCGKLRMPSSPE